MRNDETQHLSRSLVIICKNNWISKPFYLLLLFHPTEWCVLNGLHTNNFINTFENLIFNQFYGIFCFKLNYLLINSHFSPIFFAINQAYSNIYLFAGQNGNLTRIIKLKQKKKHMNRTFNWHLFIRWIIAFFKIDFCSLNVVNEFIISWQYSNKRVAAKEKKNT